MDHGNARCLLAQKKLTGMSISPLAERLPNKFYEVTEVSEEKSMKYLCLVYCDEINLFTGSESPLDAESLAYAESLSDSKRLLAGESLESVYTATTVRVRNGKVSVSDGPSAETGKQLVGFYLVSARDLNEAIHIAADIPAARVGFIDVRPVRKLQA